MSTKGVNPTMNKFRALIVALIMFAPLPAFAQPAGAACLQRRPTVTVTPTSQPVAPGGVVFYDVKIRNRDGRGCAPTTFLVQASASSTGGQRLSVEFMVLPGNYVWETLRPQQTVRLTLRARADTDAASGTYNGTVYAHEWEHPEHGGAAFVEAVIP